MNINSRTFTPLVTSILMCVVIVGAYFYMQSVVGSSVDAVISTRDRMASEESSRGQNNGLVSVYNDTMQARARLAGFFVPADDIVKLIVAVESIGPQSGTTLTLTSIEDPSTSPTTVTESGEGFVRMRVSAQGSWSGVMKALKLAETVPYATALTSVNLDTSVLGNSSAKRTWSLTFELHAALATSTSAATGISSATSAIK